MKSTTWTDVSSRSINIFWWLDKILFVLIVIYLFVVALTDLDVQYDNLAYHLPFTARRVGIIPESAFRFGWWLEDCYRSFPPLPYYINGAFWRLTGIANGGALLNLLGFSTFCLFINRVFRVPILLAFVALAAIPAIQVNIVHAAVEMLANLSFTAALVLATLVLIDGRGAWWALGALAAAALAGNYKPQFIPLAGMFAVAFPIAIVLFKRHVALIESIGRKKALFWALTALAVVGCYDVAVRNAVFYGNPLFPAQISLLGHTLPGVHINDLYTEPQYLRHTPQPLRWLLSIVEYRALDSRPIPYTPGQGDVPAGSHSTYMGGYFSAFVVFNLWVFFTLSWRKGGKHRWLMPVFIVGSVAIAYTPSSHNLRFFSFWILYLVTINFAYLWLWNTDGLAGRRYFSAVAFSSFVFVTAITGGSYFLSFGRSLDSLSAQFEIDRRFVSKFEDGNTYCLLNWGQLDLLAAAPLRPGRSYSILKALALEECTEANAIPVDYDASP